MKPNRMRIAAISGVSLTLVFLGALSNWVPEIATNFNTSVSVQEAVALHKTTSGLSDRDIALIARTIVSLVFGGGALWAMLSAKSTDEQKHWAAGIIGTVVGYWLKG